MDESLPCRAILNVQIEVHNLEKNGECSGKIASMDKLKEYGLMFKRLYKLDGDNLHFCLMKLKEIMDNFK
jgi:hypothetical protein